LGAARSGFWRFAARQAIRCCLALSGVIDMRKIRTDRRLAGKVLALLGAFAVTAPGVTHAAPDRVESAMPLPPLLNGRAPLRRDAAPLPPPPAERAPAARAAEPSPPPAQPAAAQTQTPDNGSYIKSALDKIFAASDAQVSDKLREIVTGKQLERRVERAPERKAVESFYAARNYAPLWIRDGALTARAKTTIARLKNAAADGLDASDYPVPDFANLSSAEQVADGELRLTNSVLTYARHLQVGRIAPTRVLAEVDYGSHVPEPADILRKIADAGDVNAAFDGFDPPHPGFKALKEKLAELRSNASADENRIPDGAPIRPGARDARVPALRERLGLKGNAGDLAYDKALFNAVRQEQHSHDLKPNGIVDARTIAAINGPKAGQKIDRIVANMERWRWLPRDLGRTYVMVNIPDYTLKVVHDHQPVWHTKIVAGKPQTPTPLLSASMDTVLLNPSWYVPQSIIQNELLPLYASDPNIFDRMGLEVKRGPDGHINVVQPPGAANALGRIKFNFPNKFQVYLHDTPEKRLFAADKRAFSHGCMRVEDPTKFGEIILHLAINGRTPTSQQLYAQFGQEEHVFKLTERPMVHLTYQTAFVDDTGKLQLRDDLYGFDARIHAILHSDERRIADVAPPPDPKRDAATEKSNQELLSRVERREAQNPFSFFERLFR
jgi:murein L,D-transpeptidase YcbB/YkuD